MGIQKQDWMTICVWTDSPRSEGYPPFPGFEVSMCPSRELLSDIYDLFFFLFVFFFFSITICAHGRVTDHKVKVVVCSAHGLDIVFAGVYSPPKHFKCVVNDLWAALSLGCSQNAALSGLFFTLTFENLSRNPVWSQLLNHNCNLPSQLLSCNADICSSHGGEKVNGLLKQNRNVCSVELSNHFFPSYI